MDLTYSTGINVSGSPSGWSFNSQIGVSVDTEGNVAVQASVAGGISTGTPGASATIYNSISNAPDISNLNGPGYQIGGTVIIPTNGPNVSIGGDFNIIPDPKNSQTYYGVTANAGLALGTPGGEVHVEWGHTIKLVDFNIFNIAEQVYDNIMEW